MSRPNARYPELAPCTLSELVGHLALFREPPGLRVIVRVLAVRRDEHGHDAVSLEAVVAARHGERLLFRRGERLEVSGPPGRTRNEVWSLHRLASTDPATAIDEATERFGRLGVTFAVEDLPS